MSSLNKRFLRLMKERRVIRYSLLAFNVLLLGGVVLMVLQSSPSTTTQRSSVNAANGTADAPSDPLDQLSSADIAVNLARMTNLAEQASVVNQADSVSAELAMPAVYKAVISKPQTVATELKSRQDIQDYTVAAGDTVSSIAAKFGVTSDSIKWSNNLSADTVAAGTVLTIPPVNGIVYVVKAGDTADALATKYKASKEQIIAYNDAEIGGLRTGEKIIIPNGQQPVAVRSSYAVGGYAWGSSAIYGYNGYDYGFCTWYVANKRIEIGRALPANLGNAATWDDRASFAGLPVNKTPAVGAAVVTSQRGAGHVAFVERVQEDGIWVSEMNSRGFVAMDPNSGSAGGWNKRDFKFIPMATAVTYNYIH